MTDLSVVIVTYNSAAYLDECLASLLPQLEPLDAQLFVVDNASADDSVAHVKELLDGHAGPGLSWKVIENESNRGFAPANNQALQQCTGEMILLTNPDTRFTPGSIAALMEIMKEDGRFGMVAPQLTNPDGSVQPSCRRFPSYRGFLLEIFGLSALFPNSPHFNYWKIGGFDHTIAMDIDQPMGACFLVRRAAMDGVGLLDEQFEMFFNDVDWCKRFVENGWVIRFDPRAVVMHYGGVSVEAEKARMILHSHAGFYRYFEKHFRRWWQRPLNAVVALLLLVTAPLRILGRTVRARLGLLHPPPAPSSATTGDHKP